MKLSSQLRRKKSAPYVVSETLTVLAFLIGKNCGLISFTGGTLSSTCPTRFLTKIPYFPAVVAAKSRDLAWKPRGARIHADRLDRVDERAAAVNSNRQRSSRPCARRAACTTGLARRRPYQLCANTDANVSEKRARRRRKTWGEVVRDDSGITADP